MYSVIFVGERMKLVAKCDEMSMSYYPEYGEYRLMRRSKEWKCQKCIISVQIANVSEVGSVGVFSFIKNFKVNFELTVNVFSVYFVCAKTICQHATLSLR